MQEYRRRQANKVPTKLNTNVDIMWIPDRQTGISKTPLNVNEIRQRVKTGVQLLQPILTPKASLN